MAQIIYEKKSAICTTMSTWLQTWPWVSDNRKTYENWELHFMVVIPVLLFSIILISYELIILSVIWFQILVVTLYFIMYQQF